jgi:crotonobetainyl-CoA:carnitine CoA-transferase CaiB-like acyl-CoA transferase
MAMGVDAVGDAFDVGPGDYIPARWAGMLVADHGAEVTKVDRPGTRSAA